jgi:ComF family protein
MVVSRQPLQGEAGPGRSAAAAPRCVRCRRGRRTVDRGRAIGLYEGTLREVIHAFKYQRRRSIGRALAARMRVAGADLLRDADIVVPVPLHPRRRRQRGFNQAEDLARGLGLPVVGALRRVRATRSQVELPAAQRHKNVRNAFTIVPPRRRGWLRRRDAVPALDGLCVVLVDDVSTTGATLDACARALKAAGVREVRALTAARVAGRRR